MISGIDKIRIGLIISVCVAVWLIDSASVRLALIFGLYYVQLCLFDPLK